MYFIVFFFVKKFSIAAAKDDFVISSHTARSSTLQNVVFKRRTEGSLSYTLPCRASHGSVASARFVPRWSIKQPTHSIVTAPKVGSWSLLLLSHNPRPVAGERLSECHVQIGRALRKQARYARRSRRARDFNR